MKGVVKWFDDSKGFGYITDERGRDFWVHYSDIEMKGFKTLKPAQKVKFNGYETDLGLQAKDVKVYE